MTEKTKVKPVRVDSKKKDDVYKAHEEELRRKQRSS